MNDHTLRSRMKGDFHVRFWNSGRGSDRPVDCIWVMKLRNGEYWPGVYGAKLTLKESRKYDPELNAVYNKLLAEVYFRLDGAMKAFRQKLKDGKRQASPESDLDIVSSRCAIQGAISGLRTRE